MVGPVTEWNQAPFFAWEFLRPDSNFLVRRIKNFRTPSWFLAAIFYFSTPKRLWVMKYFFKSQPINILSPDHYWVFSRVYRVTGIQQNYCCTHTFWSPLNLNAKKYRIYQFFYILLRTFSSDLVIKHSLADFQNNISWRIVVLGLKNRKWRQKSKMADRNFWFFWPES